MTVLARDFSTTVFRFKSLIRKRGDLKLILQVFSVSYFLYLIFYWIYRVQILEVFLLFSFLVISFLEVMACWFFLESQDGGFSRLNNEHCFTSNNFSHGFFCSFVCFVFFCFVFSLQSVISIIQEYELLLYYFSILKNIKAA